MTTILKYGLCISVIFARNKIIFGEIKNEEGISLESVNIVSIPSQIGTQSNEKGYFSFNVDHQDTLIKCSHVGYGVYYFEIESFKNGTPIVLKDKILAMDSLQVSAINQNEFERFNVKNNVIQFNVEELSRRGYTDLGDVLFNEESILMNENVYGQKSMSVRGSSKEELIYLFDGISLNNLGDPSLDLNLMSSSGLSGIELVKGGHQKGLSSSGTINLVPKILYSNSLLFKQQFGTYNYGRYNFHGSLGNHFSSFNVGIGEGKSTQLYSDMAYPEITTFNKQKYSNIALKDKKGLEIRFMAQQNSKRYFNERTRDSINLNMENYILKLVHTNLKENIVKAYGIYQSYAGQDFVGSTIFEKDDSNSGYGFEFLMPIKNGMISILNQSSYPKADWYLNSTPVSVDRFASNTTAVFESYHPKTNNEFQLKDVKLIYSQQKIVDSPYGEFFDYSLVYPTTNVWKLRSTYFSGSALNRQDRNILMMYANIGNTFRVPSLSEIGFNYKHSSNSNGIPLQLRPEQKNTFEIGLKVEEINQNPQKKYHGTLSWFRYNYIDKIKHIYFSGSPSYFPINAGEVSLKGFDSKFFYNTNLDRLVVSQTFAYYIFDDPTAFPFQPEKIIRNKIQLKTKLFNIELIYKIEGKRHITTMNNDLTMIQNYVKPINNFDINIHRIFSMNRFQGTISVSGRNLKNVSQELNGVSIYDRRYILNIMMRYK